MRDAYDGLVWNCSPGTSDPPPPPPPPPGGDQQETSKVQGPGEKDRRKPGKEKDKK